MPNAAPPANPRVVALIYEQLCVFKFGIAAGVFALPRIELGPDWYRFLVCAERPGSHTTNAGISVHAEAGLEALEEIGTIVIPP